VIVHDFLEAFGGAERVTAELAAAFPDAPVYAIMGRRWVAREMGIEDRFVSLLPSRGMLLDRYRLLTPAFPALLDRLRLPTADVLLSSSYAFAHRLRTRNDATHVCYCHSPLRFAWTMTDQYRASWAPGRLRAGAFNALAANLRRADLQAAARVDRYLTQGSYTAGQIKRFYGRDAGAIGAPIDCDLFSPSGRPPDDYYLFCGRLVEPYSRVSALIEAFRRLPDRRLVVAGTGPAEATLRASAPANVSFTGRVDDDEFVSLMQHCLALISPTRHDYGLIPIEAMACGRPVLALGEGGVLETVQVGRTGELFHAPTAEAIATAVAGFDPSAYDPAAIRAHALRWDRRSFRQRFTAEVVAAARARSSRNGGSRSNQRSAGNPLLLWPNGPARPSVPRAMSAMNEERIT
jgi:glycosyltransferase involved in cell wall biosynthesis